MAAIVAILEAILAFLLEIGPLLTRLFFLIKDAWNILKWNFLFLVRIFENLPTWLGKIGQWVFEFVAILPGRIGELGFTEVAKLINLAFASSCCGFIADAVHFPSVSASIPGLAYFVEPFRIEYGIGIILCALSISFILKMRPNLPIGRLPRLPAPKWPQLPGP